jgi:hypothetical protein
MDPKIGNEALPQFHRTISEQLNARLSEAPRFFWAVILSITAYAYVLWWYAGEKQTPERFYTVFLLVSGVAYLSILWVLMYIAALGYAFRYLQNSQHRIEEVLGWEIYRPETTGVPPDAIRSTGDLFWLLPGIYHAHLYGLIFLSIVIHVIFVLILPDTGGAALTASLTFIAETVWILSWNYHYLRKFRHRHVRPWIARPRPN